MNKYVTETVALILRRTFGLSPLARVFLLVRGEDVEEKVC